MLLRFVKNNLLAKPLRNILVIISCIVSIALMLIMVNISGQINNQFNVGASNYNYVLGGNCSNTELVLDGLFFYDMPTKRLDISYMDEVKSLTGVGSVVPIAMADNVTGTAYKVVGTTNDFFTVSHYQLKNGEYLGDYVDSPSSAKVVVGSNVADNRDFVVGSTFTASHSADSAGEHAGYFYIVVGILEETGTAIDNCAYTHYQAVWKSHSEGHEEEEEGEEEGEDNHVEEGFVHLLLIAAGPTGINNLNEKYNGNSNVTLASTVTTLSSVYGIFGNAGKIVVAIIVIVIVMAFNMLFLAMFTAAGERRREIAILRALGSSRGKILLTIILESVIILFISAVLGWLLSFAGLAIVGNVFTGMLGIVVSPTALYIEELYIILGSFGVGLVATLIPALMVYNTEPSKYLR